MKPSKVQAAVEMSHMEGHEKIPGITEFEKDRGIGFINLIKKVSKACYIISYSVRIAFLKNKEWL